MDNMVEVIAVLGSLLLLVIVVGWVASKDKPKEEVSDETLKMFNDIFGSGEQKIVFSDKINYIDVCLETRTSSGENDRLTRPDIRIKLNDKTKQSLLNLLHRQEFDFSKAYSILYSYLKSKNIELLPSWTETNNPPHYFKERSSSESGRIIIPLITSDGRYFPYKDNYYVLNFWYNTLIAGEGDENE